MARQVGEDWPFNVQHLFHWQDELWAVEAQALVWWVRDVVVLETRRVASYDEWLANERYCSLVTQEQLEGLINQVRDAPGLATRTIGSLACQLFGDLSEEKLE